MTSPTGKDDSYTQERDSLLRYAPWVDWIATGQSHAKLAPHIGHLHHLCDLAQKGQMSLEEMKGLVKDAKYICRICGRAAANADNLCAPDLLSGTAVETPTAVSQSST